MKLGFLLSMMCQVITFTQEPTIFAYTDSSISTGIIDFLGLSLYENRPFNRI